MGTCECARHEEDHHEINVTFKDKRTYSEDYDTYNQNKAKAIQNNFTLVDQDDEEEERRKRLKIVIEAKSKDEDDIPIKDNAFDFNQTETFRQINTIKEEEEEFGVTFSREPTKISKKKPEVVTVMKPSYLSTNESTMKNQLTAPSLSDTKHQVTEFKNVINEVKPPEQPHQGDISYLDKSAISGDSDIDDTIFNSAKYSKELFTLLNNIKSAPSNYKDQIRSFIIPKGSKANEDNRNEVMDFIDKLPKNHKGKTYLWNEKAYGVLRPILQRKANGEQVEEDVNKIFENVKVKANIDSYYETVGRYDVKQTLFSLLLENSHSIRRILFDNIQICTICSVQSKNKMKTMSCLVLIKNK